MSMDAFIRDHLEIVVVGLFSLAGFLMAWSRP